MTVANKKKRATTKKKTVVDKKKKLKDRVVQSGTHDINVFNDKKEYLDIFCFKTTASKSINVEFLTYSLKNIDRTKAILVLMDHIPADIAIKVELSILEFTLITVTFDKLCTEMIKIMYADKLKDICMNLDINNKYINNKTLKNSLVNNHIDPYYIAFLSPQQIHPARWKNELDKQHAKENIDKDVKVTDIYKCYKCGERKSKTSQMQTRSADEPMTIFVTCMVCYNTFTK